MDLSRGCILVARSLDESDIFQNEKWLKVWVWCMIQANHEGKNVPVNIGKSKTSVWISRGQFIFGRHKAAKKLDMNPSTVRNIMDKFENDFKNLDIKKDTHFSIVTVRDFSFYQDMKNYKGQVKGQVKGQPEDSQRTARGQPEDTTNTPKSPNTLKEKIYTDSFEKNWKEYIKLKDLSKYAGHDKKKASIQYEQLSVDEKEVLPVAIKNYSDDMRSNNQSSVFKMNNFLKEGTWKDWIKKGINNSSALSIDEFIKAIKLKKEKPEKDFRSKELRATVREYVNIFDYEYDSPQFKQVYNHYVKLCDKRNTK